MSGFRPTAIIYLTIITQICLAPGSSAMSKSEHILLMQQSNQMADRVYAESLDKTWQLDSAWDDGYPTGMLDLVHIPEMGPEERAMQYIEALAGFRKRYADLPHLSRSIDLFIADHYLRAGHVDKATEAFKHLAASNEPEFARYKRMAEKRLADLSEPLRPFSLTNIDSQEQYWDADYYGAVLIRNFYVTGRNGRKIRYHLRRNLLEEDIRTAGGDPVDYIKWCIEFLPDGGRIEYLIEGYKRKYSVNRRVIDATGKVVKEEYVKEEE